MPTNTYTKEPYKHSLYTIINVGVCMPTCTYTKEPYIRKRALYTLSIYNNTRVCASPLSERVRACIHSLYTQKSRIYTKEPYIHKRALYALSMCNNTVCVQAHSVSDCVPT